MDGTKLPPMHDPGWADALIVDIEQSTKDAVALETARHGKTAAPVSAIVIGMMVGDILAAIHELAKRVDEINRTDVKGVEALNQTVEAFASALADLDENGFRYRGYWRQGMQAKRGDAYTENGSLWYCLRATYDPPRKESPDWNICARAGRDGRDAQ
jgi:hypothetical protein